MSCTNDIAPLFDWVETTETKKSDIANSRYSHERYIKEKITSFMNNIQRETPRVRSYCYQTYQYSTLLHEVFLSNYLNEPANASKQEHYIIVLYKIMLHTRDIINGRGEYQLFYEFLTEWVKLAVELQYIMENKSDVDIYYKKKAYWINQFANKAIYYDVYQSSNSKPYGCWKDIKYFLTYLRSRNDIKTTIYRLPIFTFIIQMVVNQLRKDVNSDSPSLLAKWLPREKSKKFGWLAKHFAYEYFSKWISNTEVSINHNDKPIYIAKHTAERKCLTHYRRLLATINRRLKTVQINQCSKMWNEIDFDSSVTSTTMMRQRYAFQYKNRSGYILGNDIDRIICKTNYDSYIERKMCKIDTLQLSDNARSYEMIKMAMRIVDNNLNREYSNNIEMYPNVNKVMEEVKQKWEITDNKHTHLSQYIPVIDMSISMEGVSLIAAMTLGCRILDQSKNSFGKGRMITFNSEPEWKSLSNCDSVISMVEEIAVAQHWNTTTNIISTMMLILKECQKQELSPTEVGDLTLVVMTNLIIQNADKNVCAACDTMKEMFEKGGLETKHAKPYPVPRIIYWDMRITRTIPTIYNINNIKVINGFTPEILNTMCDSNKDLNEYTQWCMVNSQLNGTGKYYSWVDELIQSSELCKKTCIDEEPININLVREKIVTKSSGWSWW